MKTLARQDYTRYTETALKLESLIYVQNRVIGNLEQMYKSREPQLPQESMSSKPMPEFESRYDKSELYRGAIPYFVIGVIGLAMIFVATWINNSHISPFLLLPGLFFLFLDGIGLLMELGEYLLCKIKDRQSASLVMEAYERECKAVQERNEAAAEAYHQQHADWENLGKQYREAEDFMRTQLKQTEAMLEKLYSLDVIYPKYRTIAALASISEYFATGRCDELGGTHGAYNLYEDEVRKDSIISRLDISASDLERIRNTQYVLYRQITQIRQAIAEMTRSLADTENSGCDIRANVTVSEFYEEVNDELQNCLKTMDEMDVSQKDPKVILKKAIGD